MFLWTGREFLPKLMEWQLWGIIDSIKFTIYSFRYLFCFYLGWYSVKSYLLPLVSMMYLYTALQGLAASVFCGWLLPTVLLLRYNLKIDGFKSICLISCGIWWLLAQQRLSKCPSRSWLAYLVLIVILWFVLMIHVA